MFFTELFSVGSGRHQLSFFMCSWVCLGIGWWHCHTLQTATISLCECVFSRDCTRSTNNWSSRGNRSKPFSICKCTSQEQVRLGHRDGVCKRVCVYVWVGVGVLAHDCWKQDKCDTSCLFRELQICDGDNFQPPHKRISSSQIVYNLSGINVENYLVATANDFIRNRWAPSVSLIQHMSVSHF